MDNQKYESRIKMAKYGLVIGGVSMLALGVLAYMSTQYVMMGFMLIIGLLLLVGAYVSGAIFYKLSLLQEKEEEGEHHEEQL